MVKWRVIIFIKNYADWSTVNYSWCVLSVANWFAFWKLSPTNQVETHWSHIITCLQRDSPAWRKHRQKNLNKLSGLSAQCTFLKWMTQHTSWIWLLMAEIPVVNVENSALHVKTLMKGNSGTSDQCLVPAMSWRCWNSAIYQGAPVTGSGDQQR